MDTEKADRISDEIVTVLNAHIPDSTAAELLCGQLLAIIALGRMAPQPIPPKYKAVLQATDACLAELLIALEVHQTARKN